jgi:hypothetical protein
LTGDDSGGSIPVGDFALTGTPPLRSGRLGTVSLAMVLLALLISPASAAGAKQRARHLPFGQWVAFNAGLAGSFDAQGLFRFSSQKRVVLRVTDAFCRGDRYRILDHGHRRGITTQVPTDTSCTRLPFASTGPEGWNEPGYSRVRLVLAPGRHRIRIRSLRSPFGASTGFLFIYRLG